MSKKRFRAIKQNKLDKSTKDSQYTDSPYPYAPSALKIKAYITDAFMLLMPIMYVVFYFVMDGRDDFFAHKLEGWLYIFIPLIIVQSIFQYKTGQTPGYKAYNLKLIDENSGEKPSLFSIVFRNATAVLSILTIMGWILMFFRKDYKNLHDLFSATSVIRV